MLYNKKHRTYPLLAHAPGHPQPNPFWGMLNQSIRALPLFTRLSDEVSVITFNNGHPDPIKPLGLLERQMAQFGIPCTVLGRNVPVWQHRYKMLTLAEHLKTEQRPYVLLADSADVFVVNRLETLLDRFLAYECEALVGRDPFLWPRDMKEMGDFETSVCPDSAPGYLCAGLWMAKTEFCKKLMAHCIALDNEFVKKGFPSYMTDGDDQQYLHLSFRDFYPKIKIDYNCSVFQTVVGKQIINDIQFMKVF